MADDSTRRAPIAAGIGLGLFVGFTVGLSASPVVGTLIGGIVGSLLGLLGLQRDKNAGTAATAASFLAVGAFGLTAAPAAVAGLWMRTHNALSPTIKEQVEAWTAAGFSDVEARGLVAGRALAAAEDVATKVKAKTPETAGAAAQDSVFFAGKVDPSICNEWADQHPTGPEVMNWLAQKGGPLEVLAGDIQTIGDATDRERAARAAMNVLCAK
ncbi:MAG: hypothetical protein Q8P41_15220 [Pseudomonadota bacterium]|nr:hypothetical protein [Pseudomonadota bacterium]